MGRPPKELIYLWVLATFFWWVRYYPPGVDLMVFEGDARQHVYWTARFQDPELFQNDLQTDFIISSGLDPLGYRALYWLGTRFMNPLQFSQLLNLVLLLISMWLVYGLTRDMIPDTRGRIICGLSLLLYYLYTASGGFPRSFAYPLLLSYLVLLGKGGFRRSLATLFPAVLLYPPVTLNIMALATWEFFSKRIRQVQGRKLALDTLTFAMVILAAGLFLLSVYETTGSVRGEQVTLEQAKTMADFHPEGRSVFFRETMLLYLLLQPSGIGMIQIGGFVIAFMTMGIIGGFRRLKFPSPSFQLVWTSLVVFGAAHLLLFKLHLPSRYTLYTIPLAFMLAIGASTGVFLDRLKAVVDSFPVKMQRIYRSRWLGWTVLGLLASVYVYLQGHVICQVDPTLVTLNQDHLEMLAFLETLPKDVTVAGHPMDMDNVPLVARRKVLANMELSMPFYLGFYHRVRTRLMDMLGAYYATDREEVEEFMDHYGVHALVIRRAHFRRDFLEGRIYFEPFNSAIKENWQGRENFVLANPPQRLRCFENERYIVLCWERETLP